MLTQAQPFTHLLETIDSEPLNYIKALQELMITEISITEISVPPEFDYTNEMENEMENELQYEKTKAIEDYGSAFNRSLTLDLNKIDEHSVQRYRSAFHKLAEFIRSNKTGVKFLGLKDAIRKYTKKPCCVWSCRHKLSPKRDLLQLLTALNGQSQPSPMGYVIEVISK